MTLSVFDAAAEAGQRTALVIDGRSVTFAELGRGVWARVAELAATGVTLAAPTPIALVGDVTRATLELLLASFALGVPALLLHPRSPPAARAAAAGALGARLIDRGEAPRGAPPVRESPPVSSGVTGAGESVVGALPSLPDDERPLVVLPTSGSAGAPKAVILSRRAIAAAARASAAHLGWEPDDRWLLALPIAHVGGLSVLTRCLIARRTVVVCPGADPATICGVAERERVTLLSLVPTQVVRLLAAGCRPPASVRAVLVGGAPCAPDTLARAAAAGWPLLTTYGLTETASQVTTQPLGLRPHVDLGAGVPLPGVEVAIRGGRVAVRGPTLATGYAIGGVAPASPRGPDGAASSASCQAPQGLPGAFEPLPLDAEGWFHTGDLGHLDSLGRLHVHGRADRVIVTGGEKVAPERVEAELLALPEVVEAAVVGRPDPEWGLCVVAYVVWSGAPLPLGEARARLAGRLAAHELPRELRAIERLPRLPNGKLDRRGLDGLALGAG